jgi:hypothetical protein
MALIFETAATRRLSTLELLQLEQLGECLHHRDFGVNVFPLSPSPVPSAAALNKSRAPWTRLVHNGSMTACNRLEPA